MESILIHQALFENDMVVRRLNAQQLRQMVEHGMIRDGEPVELIDGMLINKDRRDVGSKPMTHGPRHASVIHALRSLHPLVEARGFELRLQLPITISDYFEPEPDGAIVRGPSDKFTERHPGPKDVVVVIEVADTSLKYDRTTKQTIYAEAGLPSYCIVNLQDRVVELFSGPIVAEGRYATVAVFRPGELMTFDMSGIPLNIDPAALMP